MEEKPQFYKGNRGQRSCVCVFSLTGLTSVCSLIELQVIILSVHRNMSCGCFDWHTLVYGAL